MFELSENCHIVTVYVISVFAHLCCIARYSVVYYWHGICYIVYTPMQSIGISKGNEMKTKDFYNSAYADLISKALCEAIATGAAFTPLCYVFGSLRPAGTFGSV
jgi:hypothetical protein